MADPAICSLSVQELSEKIRTRAISPVEAVEAHLDRIEALNGDYVAFVTVCADQALAAARAAEAEIAAGRRRGPLHGIPYGAKDIFDTAGVCTANGSCFYFDNVPAASAHAIDRLEAAGAILLGKTNTHEFAAASTTINQYFGTSRNPWDPSRIVGGSSGGSAAALAARMCPVALGTDTGGSIRTPSALCGVVGLKPTHGRVSLRGIYRNTPTFDHAGPMTRTVRDAALVLQAMAGYDPLDPKSADVPVPDYSAAIDDGVKGARIVYSPDFHRHAEVDADIVAAFARAIEVLRGLGASVEEVPFAGAERFPDVFRRISGPEFSEVHRAHFTENPDAYDTDVRARVEWSLEVTLDEYVRALGERELLIRDTEALFAGADAMISPSVPCAAPPIDTLMAEINGREVPYRNLHRPFLTPFNLTGCPAITLPMGLNAKGLPISLQVASGRWREADVLRVAQAFEAATPELRSALPPCG